MQGECPRRGTGGGTRPASGLGARTDPDQPVSSDWAWLACERSRTWFENQPTLIVVRGRSPIVEAQLSRSLASATVIVSKTEATDPAPPGSDRRQYRSVSAALAANSTPLIVIGRNSKSWQIKRWYTEARRHGYHVLVVHVSQDLPRFCANLYGYFLNPTDSSALLARAHAVLAGCRARVDLGFPTPERLDFHRPPIIDTPLLHCTMKFQSPSIPTDYVNNPEVIAHQGRVADLIVVGLLVTPMTFGAQIALSPEQRPLYGEGYRHPSSPEATGPDPAADDRCHITLGLVGDIRPIQTGFDMARANRWSRAPTTDAQSGQEIRLAHEMIRVRQLEGEMWLIQLSPPWVYPAAFLSSC